MAHSGYCGKLDFEAKRARGDGPDKKRDTLLTRWNSRPPGWAKALSSGRAFA
jgi:hypothetical protein